MATFWEGTANPLNDTPVVLPKKLRLDPYLQRSQEQVATCGTEKIVKNRLI